MRHSLIMSIAVSPRPSRNSFRGASCVGYTQNLKGRVHRRRSFTATSQDASIMPPREFLSMISPEDYPTLAYAAIEASLRGRVCTRHHLLRQRFPIFEHAVRMGRQGRYACTPMTQSYSGKCGPLAHCCAVTMQEHCHLMWRWPRFAKMNRSSLNTSHMRVCPMWWSFSY